MAKKQLKKALFFASLVFNLKGMLNPAEIDPIQEYYSFIERTQGQLESKTLTPEQFGPILREQRKILVTCKNNPRFVELLVSPQSNAFTVLMACEFARLGMTSSQINLTTELQSMTPRISPTSLRKRTTASPPNTTPTKSFATPFIAPRATSGEEDCDILANKKTLKIRLLSWISTIFDCFEELETEQKERFSPPSP